MSIVDRVQNIYSFNSQFKGKRKKMRTKYKFSTPKEK